MWLNQPGWAGSKCKLDIAQFVQHLAKRRRTSPSPLCDPLTRLGRQFCRTVHAFFPLKTLLANGTAISTELAAFPEETLTLE